MLPDSSESTVLPTKVVISECSPRWIMPSSITPATSCAEAHAARAVDAARHLLHRDQRADVLGEDDALVLVVARRRRAVADREILQLALAALVADRAVERVVDQQELHHALLRLDRLVALGARRSCPASPASRTPASASAPSRPRPGTCGNWPRSSASCDSRSAGCRCRPCRQHASPCCPRAPRPSCRRVRFRSWLHRCLTRAMRRPRRHAVLQRRRGRGERGIDAVGRADPAGVHRRRASRCGATNSSRKCLIIARTGIAAASPSAQIVRPWMLSATEFSRSRSSHPALAVVDAVDHAVQPAGAFAARRALAAALVHVEVREAQQRLDHAARVVHHDHRARAEHRAGLGDRVVVHRQSSS